MSALKVLESDPYFVVEFCLSGEELGGSEGQPARQRTRQGFYDYVDVELLSVLLMASYLEPIQFTQIGGSSVTAHVQFPAFYT